jgi:hypothetical protein
MDVSALRRTFTALVLLVLGGAAVAVLPPASASAVPDSTPALVATGVEAMSLVWRGSTPSRLNQQSSAHSRWSDDTEFAGAGGGGARGGGGVGGGRGHI